MSQRTVSNESDLRLLFNFLSKKKRPFSVSVVDGRRRSVSQNSLQHLWLQEAAEQLGDRTPEELRGEMKLTLGVPILRSENEDFREKYDLVVRPLPYEAKLAIMMEPLDMPITRIMSVAQKTKYLEQMERFFLEQGVALTRPEHDG